MVRAVPRVSERTKPRWITDELEQSNKLLTVWLAARDSWLRPDALAVSVRLLKVFAPLIVRVPTAVLVKETL